jgi:hypothetical protein
MSEKAVKTDGRKLLLNKFELVGISNNNNNNNNNSNLILIYLCANLTAPGANYKVSTST